MANRYGPLEERFNARVEATKEQQARHTQQWSEFAERAEDDRNVAIARAEAAEQRVAELERRVASIHEWTLRYGSSLVPHGVWADSFGDGMRAAKQQVAALVSKLIVGCAPSAEPATPAATGAERAHCYRHAGWRSDCEHCWGAEKEQKT